MKEVGREGEGIEEWWNSVRACDGGSDGIRIDDGGAGPQKTRWPSCTVLGRFMVWTVLLLLLPSSLSVSFSFATRCCCMLGGFVEGHCLLARLLARGRFAGFCVVGVGVHGDEVQQLTALRSFVAASLASRVASFCFLFFKSVSGTGCWADIVSSRVGVEWN